MPRVLHRHLRFAVIDHCLRDTSREYRIGDLLEKCNRKMMQYYGTCISRRTLQYDLHILQQPPFNISLDEQLLRRNIYRYSDTNCQSRVFMLLDE